MIIDLVDAAPLRPGVLLSGNRISPDARHLLNVSLSRAGQAVLVADVAYFEAAAPDGIVTAILRDAIREGAHAWATWRGARLEPRSRAHHAPGSGSRCGSRHPRRFGR